METIVFYVRTMQYVDYLMMTVKRVGLWINPKVMKIYIASEQQCIMPTIG